MMHILYVPAPPDFSYAATIGSHGWRRLAPFAFDEASGTLTRVQRLDGGELCLLRINPDTESLRVEVEGNPALSEAQTEQISRAVRTIFSLDWDLSAVYNAFRDHP